MSRTQNFNRWRASLPWLERECRRCGQLFTTQRATYCSDTCRSYSHKERRTGKKVGIETRCWWCAGPLPVGRHRFCTVEHLDQFKRARRKGRRTGQPLVFFIGGVRVETQQWDRVGEVMRGWLLRVEQGTVPR